MIKDYISSTSSFYKVEEGIVFKSLYSIIIKRNIYKLIVKKKILERLGKHLRLIKYIHLYIYN
jgi:hypothetical protein